MKELVITSMLLSLALPYSVQAAGQHDHGHGQGMPASHGSMGTEEHAALVGKPGDPKRVSRTIDVVLSDDMRFTPATIDVKAGETIRFFVRNTGKMNHEMVLGQIDDLKAHAKEMRANPDMVHKEPNQVNLKPGQRGGMVWQFIKPGTVDFACTMPGHLEAGMVGQVTVAP